MKRTKVEDHVKEEGRGYKIGGLSHEVSDDDRKGIHTYMPERHEPRYT